MRNVAIPLPPLPDNEHRHHHQHLINIEPTLYEKSRQTEIANQKLVVEYAERTKHSGTDKQHNPGIMRKHNTFALSATA